MLRIYYLYLIFFVFVTTASIFGQEKVDELFDERNELYIKFSVPNETDISTLSKKLSIDRLADKGNTKEITAYLNRKEFELFSNQNINFEIQTPPSLKLAVSMCSDLNAVKNWDCYPTYSQYTQTMESFAINYPNLCQLVEYGQSNNGRKLLALKISDNVMVKEEEPEFFYTSTMHGDETTGYALMIRLIDYLLANYGTDQRVTDLVNNTEIWINPLSNPDGTYYTSDDNINGATRSNSYGIDLNRNFPDPQEGDHPDGNAWQKENIAMMNFLNDHNFVLSANLHGGVEVLNYPWDTWQKRHPDDLWYQEICREYADTVHNNSSGYMTYLDNGITNGWDWYAVAGGRQDYVNYFLHGREVTLEISDTKMVDPATLNTYWNYNYRSFLNYINRVHSGIFGKVTDQFGSPLRAMISLTGYDTDSSQIYSGSANGMYFRMLRSGNYHLVATAENHYPAEFDITIADGIPTELNILLQGFPEGINKVNDSTAIITNFINPFNTQIKIELELKQANLIYCNIVNINGQLVKQQKFSGKKGTNHFYIKSDELANGIYFCQIYSKLFHHELKLIKIN